MAFIALRKVCPELVSAAEKHAAGITKIELNGMFESTEGLVAEEGLELVVVFAGKSYILSAAGDKLGIISAREKR
jgi:hypothetical protein